PSRAGWRIPGPCSAHAGLKKTWQKPKGHETDIKVYNSLTRTKEPFVLADSRTASWYSCGPTVYDHAHLGHASSYVRFDIVRRILTKVFGIDVVMVMVITDIDDKIIRRANELNVSPAVLARIYEEDFKQDMTSLKVLPPTVYMRVTDNIPKIVDYIDKIIYNGNAYATSTGNVYFDIQSIGSRYGKLIGVSADFVGEPGVSDKKDARDFALWKASKPQEPFWESPWGRGRPGWHIECSTVASSVFGNKLDIHSGGIDLAFPHHENEIAQCEAYHQCEQWGNYFLHSGHLHLKGSEEKMSKSLKNYITIQVKFISSRFLYVEAVFCVAAVDYSEASMSEAKAHLQSISSFINNASAYMRGQLMCPEVDEILLWERLSTTKINVQTALADDFDTPRAIDSIMNLVHHGNRQLQVVPKGAGYTRSPVVFGSIISYIDQFLDTVGISLRENQVTTEGQSLAALHGIVDQLVDFRQKVRNYALAVDEPAPQRLMNERQPLLQACDSLRLDLTAIGIDIKVSESIQRTMLQFNNLFNLPICCHQLD
uniref:Probable cysteine--tRNA ligase, mitochondrial n=1 Tax=Callorhinchus milii TaxID=7868 RepID=A0A4W3IR61_CALMI